MLKGKAMASHTAVRGTGSAELSWQARLDTEAFLNFYRPSVTQLCPLSRLFLVCLGNSHDQSP